jgi:hypothetical protein
MPALLRAAAEAQIGGGREALMAAVMATRVLAAPGAPSTEGRARRAEAVLAWLPALTLTPRVRTAVLRAVAASEGGDRGAAAEAVEGLREALADLLPRPAGTELRALADRLRRD